MLQKKKKKEHLSPINYRDFRRRWEEKHTFNLQVPLRLKAKEESPIYFWKNKCINQISPPVVRNDKLMSFKQRVHYKPCGRKALWVQVMAALESWNIWNWWRRAKSNKFFTADPPVAPVAWTQSVQLTQQRVRDEKLQFAVDQFHMAFEWANKTAKTHNTPAPDASPTREI